MSEAQPEVWGAPEGEHQRLSGFFGSPERVRKSYEEAWMLGKRAWELFLARDKELAEIRDGRYCDCPSGACANVRGKYHLAIKMFRDMEARLEARREP